MQTFVDMPQHLRLDVMVSKAETPLRCLLTNSKYFEGGARFLLYSHAIVTYITLYELLNFEYAHHLKSIIHFL